jgi:hypothetical protein
MIWKEPMADSCLLPVDSSQQAGNPHTYFVTLIEWAHYIPQDPLSIAQYILR